MFDASLKRYSKVFPCTQYQQTCIKIKMNNQTVNFPSRKLYNNITSIVLCFFRICRTKVIIITSYGSSVAFFIQIDK